MNALDATILGALQGVTEFLPISSSGHLVLMEELLKVSQPGLVFEVTVHMGTLMSILTVFWQDLKNLLSDLSTRENRMMIIYIILATIPIAVVGLVFKPEIEQSFHNLQLVGLSLLVTATALIVTKWVGKEQTEVDGKRAIIIGIAQSLALIPGISRSGITIASGLIAGLKRREAARFSFLIAIPALIGSGLLTLPDLALSGANGIPAMVLLTGLVTSFVVGIIVLKLLLGILEKGRLYYFGFYCLIVGGIVLGI
ncbi:MAG: undecaprenyl-diphosphate phosphatase [Candidatus Marinimicrobia bacterium]|nr:undecaprenyl-diphosphate phosphatase [Candidatus Neomarinimicrobiota bacterium]MDP6593840.1 undecaprenyl-diphosphate phosphatase [Candidatus Neomarinimicrobiota bacterium]MDP6836858.1 undecaprenyl-diphosphate phosphatase [Candidatus Neomarinimicrobiota bacterium]MDP6965654.1 undecaprenyl-diphosphate phosphatase [Candidatus Neomarinimicrobiota bacterium]